MSSSPTLVKLHASNLSGFSSVCAACTMRHHKWVRDLTEELEGKTREEKGVNAHGLRSGNGFLGLTPKA